MGTICTKASAKGSRILIKKVALNKSIANVNEMQMCLVSQVFVLLQERASISFACGITVTPVFRDSLSERVSHAAVKGQAEKGVVER